MRRRPAGLRRSGVVALLALLVLAACGDSKKDATPGGAASTSATATRTGAGALGGASASLGQGATPTATASTRPAPAEPVSAVTVAATDNAFAPNEFRVRAGQPFAVTLENRGQAVHDWRVRNLPDAEGRDAGTRLLTPGQSQTITLTIDRPGEFALYCEVHPVDMRGKLMVQ